MHSDATLKQIIEVGRCLVVDWGDSYELLKDVTVEEAQEGTCLPVATFRHGEEGWNVAMLCAFVIAEGFPSGAIKLPDYFTKDLKFGAEAYEEEPGAQGNTGTVSDSVKIEFVGPDGRKI